MATEQFTEAHERFTAWTDDLRLAARRLPELTAAERLSVISDLVAFLHESVEPHTRIDEQVLYHEAANRLGSPLVTAVDGVRPSRASARGSRSSPRRTTDDVDTLQELLYGLDALIRVHIWKEDELLIRPLDSSTWPASGA